MSRTEPDRDWAFFGETSAAIDKDYMRGKKVLDDLMARKIKERLEAEARLQPDSKSPLFWGRGNAII